MTLLFFWQGGVFDYEKINKDIENLNQLITDSNNWDNISLINQSQEKLKQNKNVINEFDFINNQFSQLKDFIDIFDSLNVNEINDLVYKMIDLKKCEKLKIKSLLKVKQMIVCFLEIRRCRRDWESGQKCFKNVPKIGWKNDYECKIIDIQRDDI